VKTIWRRINQSRSRSSVARSFSKTKLDQELVDCFAGACQPLLCSKYSSKWRGTKAVVFVKLTRVKLEKNFNKKEQNDETTWPTTCRVPDRWPRSRRRLVEAVRRENGSNRSTADSKAAKQRVHTVVWKLPTAVCRSHKSKQRRYTAVWKLPTAVCWSQRSKQ